MTEKFESSLNAAFTRNKAIEYPDYDNNPYFTSLHTECTFLLCDRGWNMELNILYLSSGDVFDESKVIIANKEVDYKSSSGNYPRLDPNTLYLEFAAHIDDSIVEDEAGFWDQIGQSHDVDFYTGNVSLTSSLMGENLTINGEKFHTSDWGSPSCLSSVVYPFGTELLESGLLKFNPENGKLLDCDSFPLTWNMNVKKHKYSTKTCDEFPQLPKRK